MHAPGPWHIEPLEHGGAEVTDADGKHVCELPPNPDGRQFRDTAALIAAAPYLLEALRALVNGRNAEPQSIKESDWDRARVALTLAPPT